MKHVEHGDLFVRLFKTHRFIKGNERRTLKTFPALNLIMITNVNMYCGMRENQNIIFALNLVSQHQNKSYGKSTNMLSIILQEKTSKIYIYNAGFDHFNFPLSIYLKDAI